MDSKIFSNQNICYQIDPKFYGLGTFYIDLGNFFKIIKELNLDDSNVISFVIENIKESIEISKKLKNSINYNIIVDCKNLNFAVSKMNLIKSLIKELLETFDNQLQELYIVNNSTFFKVILSLVGGLVPKITRDKLP